MMWVEDQNCIFFGLVNIRWFVRCVCIISRFWCAEFSFHVEYNVLFLRRNWVRSYNFFPARTDSAVKLLSMGALVTIYFSIFSWLNWSCIKYIGISTCIFITQFCLNIIMSSSWSTTTEASPLLGSTINYTWTPLMTAASNRWDGHRDNIKRSVWQRDVYGHSWVGFQPCNPHHAYRHTNLTQQQLRQVNGRHINHRHIW